MKERNMQFALLQVIAIVAVVVGHIGGINLMKDWFPIYQWHIPMFLFISGYFYSPSAEKSVKEYLLKKTKRLFLPCFVWNIIYCIISYLLRYNGIIDYGQVYNAEAFFLVPLWTGTQWGINLAAWFALSLFFIQIFYFLVRKLGGVHNEVALFILFLILGILGVKLSYYGYRTKWWLFLVKLLFGSACYAMGYFYKIKLESYIDRVNNTLYFVTIFFAQFVMLFVLKWSVRISMWDGVFNEFKGHSWSPFITMLPGMLFWIRVAKILEPAFLNSKIVKAISENTFSIMMHHQFVVICINYIIYKINCITPLAGFDEGAFRTNGWYAANLFETNYFHILHFFLGITIPVVLGITWKKVLCRIKVAICKIYG